MVPAAPARPILQGLMDEGFTKNLIMIVTGIDEHVIRRIIEGGNRIDRDRLARIMRLNRQVMLDQAPEGGQVPAVGSQRRLQALMRLGWSQQQLAGDDLAFRRVLTDICAGSRKRVTAGTHRRIAALYAQLSMTPGPSKIARYERIKGFSPQLAWDDDSLDDPAAHPNVDGTGNTRMSLYLTGLSDIQIAVEEKVSRDAIRVWRKRNGLEPNYKPRGRNAS